MNFYIASFYFNRRFKDFVKQVESVSFHFNFEGKLQQFIPVTFV